MIETKKMDYEHGNEKKPRKKRKPTTKQKPSLFEIQIKISAVKFAKRWRNETREASEKQTFWNEFFTMFKRDRRECAKYEEYVKTFENKSGHGSIDVFWPGTILIEHKSRGQDLDDAIAQAEGYLTGIPAECDIPKYIMVCDFFNFIFLDLQEDEKHAFTIDELKDNINLFRFMWEDKSNPIMPSIPVNIKAAETMGKIYGDLRDSHYSEQDMEYLLTRLSFCLFAEDVGIFKPNQFLDFIKKDMQPGARELGGKLLMLFDTLNNEDRQTTLPAELAEFPYVDGGLFEQQIAPPAFTIGSRSLLIESAEKYDWKDISPAIFGSLFQSVMNQDERREFGAHYTSEENIMKVIGPLFLDDLHEEFDRIIGNPTKLRQLHAKLSKMTFFDPACGAGNFLIIAYREIRRLETELLYLLHGNNKRLDIEGLSKIDVNQFYGIEVNKFSKTIAQTAMWMMDHLMNLELGEKLAVPYTRIPIEQSPHIIHGDALELDWNDILDSIQCDYVLGNPPFAGGNNMGKERLATTMQITGSGVLDYVCNWFVKAAGYVGERANIGFVATNSIAQGEQANVLWNALKNHGVHVKFAHTTFKWDSDATGKAHVHVVIVGLSKGNKNERKRLFHDGVEENPNHISPYLNGTTHETVTVASASSPINGLPKIETGTEPRDGKNYIFDETRMNAFLKGEPLAEKYMYPYIGGKDYINSDKRWILSLRDAEPSEVRAMPHVMNIIKNVQDFRAQSKNEPTRTLPPRQFYITRIPETPFLVIPKTTSGMRDYVPMGYAKPPSIPSDSIKIIENASLGLFGLLTSRMHVVWLRGIGGELKSDSRYSINIVYNTFPVSKRQSQAIRTVRAGRVGCAQQS